MFNLTQAFTVTTNLILLTSSRISRYLIVLSNILSYSNTAPGQSSASASTACSSNWEVDCANYIRIIRLHSKVIHKNVSDFI